MYVCGMNPNKKVWRLIWVLCALLLAVEVVLFFRSAQRIDAGSKLLCGAMAVVALLEIRLLQGEKPIIRKIAWLLGAGLGLVLVPQILFPETLLWLWNFSLAMLMLLSGLVMYAMVGNSAVARAFVIFLTLCVSLLMILEIASPLTHKIALGAFVTGALICIHVLVTARSN